VITHTIVRKHRGWAVVRTLDGVETVYTTTRSEARVVAKRFNERLYAHLEPLYGRMTS
jgi:hypothetical protein